MSRNKSESFASSPVSGGVAVGSYLLLPMHLTRLLLAVDPLSMTFCLGRTYLVPSLR